MQTFGLVHGDLDISGGGYVLLTGADRIRQDLALALMEEYGSDRFHPGWGSVISRYIGQVLTPELQQLVRAEVNRVIQNYISIQRAEVLRDSQVDIAGRFNTNDVVRRLISVTTSTRFDRIDAVITLETLARETVQIKKQMVAS